MSINLTKRKYLLYLTLITLLLSGVGGVTYFSLVPEHYFGGYPFCNRSGDILHGSPGRGGGISAYLYRELSDLSGI